MAAFLLAACEPPPPARVVQECLDALEAKKYEQALQYTGPAIQELYSNRQDLVFYHRQMVKSTSFAVGAGEIVTPDRAHVDVRVRFDLRDETVIDWPLRMDLSLRKRWFIDDVWHMDDEGRPRRNALNAVGAMEY